ncbi:MAG: ATP synthase F1 subunit delta [Deltaproteobacteria bacterium]|nr:ATP synthase F1 subunit delta [Deltaproteobacteria bacterium]
MSSLDDKTIAVARVYSEALLSLARELGEEESLLSELQGLASVIETDSKFRDFLSSPLVDATPRKSSLETMFRNQASDLLVDTLQVLNRKNRLGLLPAISQTYQEAYNDLRHQIDVHLTSAIPLSESQRERIREAVKKKMGLESHLIERVDPSLIGGMVLQIGDRKADASIATELRTLNTTLLTRASRQIQSGAHFEN